VLPSLSSSVHTFLYLCQVSRIFRQKMLETNPHGSGSSRTSKVYVDGYIKNCPLGADSHRCYQAFFTPSTPSLNLLTPQNLWRKKESARQIAWARVERAISAWTYTQNNTKIGCRCTPVSPGLSILPPSLPYRLNPSESLQKKKSADRKSHGLDSSRTNDGLHGLKYEIVPNWMQMHTGATKPSRLFRSLPISLAGQQNFCEKKI
jgi:hypothetical protein